MKTYEEALKYIHSLGMFSHPAGLGRMTELLDKLGNPQKSLYAVHIAGTNGKGSTAAMLTSALICAGYRVGTFVSPFIIDFCERIQINGEFIPRDTLLRLANRVKGAGVAVTEFEFITAVGFLYFKESGCDICVCETGLGGRLDATNMLGSDKLPVITKIGLDHTLVLGSTLAEIAGEKCGIIKGDRAVTCIGQHKEALDVIRKSVKTLTVPDEASLEILGVSAFKNSFLYKGKKYETRLGGAHQIQNALTAIEAIGALKIEVPYDAVYEGLKNAFFPARLEVVSREPLVVLDGAHNPDGGEALSDAMKPYSGEITAIVGMMRDKNVDEFLDMVLPHCKAVIAVTVEGNPRTLCALELKEKAERYCEKVFLANSYNDAVLKAINISNKNPIFIFGSLYLASDIRNILLDRFGFNEQ